MTSVLTQCKTSYEQLGMSPEQIAEDQKLDLVAVKAGLMQCSAVYRRDCGHEPEDKAELNFSDDDLQSANQVIRDIMLTTDDEHLKFKAATYVRDDKKGRKEIVKATQNNQFNILDINTMLQSARDGASAIKDRIASRKAINV